MNVKPLCTYMDKVRNGEKPIEEIDAIGIKEKIEEEMFLGLRKVKGYDENVFLDKYGISLEQIYGDVLEKLLHRGLLTKENDLWKLTDDGMLLANLVFTEFILEEHQLERLKNACSLDA